MAINTVRMTIAIPSTLKTAMNAAVSVVWSNVAAEAFQAKLDELQRSKDEAITMRNVVERMRAAMAAESNEDRAEGLRAGKQWAKMKATPKELRRLEQYVDCANAGAGIESDVETWASEGRGIPWHLAKVLNGPAESFDASEMREYWDFAGVNELALVDADHAIGFIEGALDVWRDVQIQLANPPQEVEQSSPAKPRGRPRKSDK